MTISLSWETLEKHIQYVESAEDYAEPGYSKDGDNPILFANWNNVKESTQKALERLGYTLEWSDEWTTCHGCYNAVRTTSDSWGWRPSYKVFNECELFCKECSLNDSEEYIESLINDPKTCDTFDFDFEKNGFVKCNGDFQNGWHAGMDDDPEKLLKEWQELHPNCDFAFSLDETSQFYITFTLWRREKAAEEQAA